MSFVCSQWEKRQGGSGGRPGGEDGWPGRWWLLGIRLKPSLLSTTPRLKCMQGQQGGKVTVLQTQGWNTNGDQGHQGRRASSSSVSSWQEGPQCRRSDSRVGAPEWAVLEPVTACRGGPFSDRRAEGSWCLPSVSPKAMAFQAPVGLAGWRSRSWLMGPDTFLRDRLRRRQTLP